ncbi:MAG: phosphate ABC transporter permease subunit PstC, partial [Phormidium sp. GEM2.Bin31]
MTSGSDRDFASSGQSLDIYKRASTARILDLGFWGLTLSLALGGGAVLIWIIFQTAIAGWPAMQLFGLRFLITTSWDPVNNIYGVLPQIYGTLVTTAIALIVA